MSEKYRPSHADATYDFKYGVRSVQVMFLKVIIVIALKGKELQVYIVSVLIFFYIMLLVDKQGGGRSSARETIGRVAAGAVAKKILKYFSGTEVGCVYTCPMVYQFY